MKKVNFILFVFLLLIIGCNEKPSVIINGVYHADNKSLKRKLIRSSIPEFQFIVNGKNGTISYFDSRGISDYNLAVSIEKKSNFIEVRFDSLISSAHLVSSKIDSLNKNDLLFTYSTKNDSTLILSEYFLTKSTENKQIIFKVNKDTIDVEELDYFKPDGSASKIINEYLGRRKYEKKKVIIVPCYNGYEYAQLGYNFNPFLEKKLSKIDTIRFIPFPLKKMQGSGYQSVYDKKYCAEIIKNTNADYLIMTRFTGNVLDVKATNRIWGYETKILNVKTMEQVISIKANNLSSYEEIEIDISMNLKQLVSDILKY